MAKIPSGLILVYGRTVKEATTNASAPIKEIKPLVMCKDCKWWKRERGYEGICDHKVYHLTPHPTQLRTTEDFYCGMADWDGLEEWING